MRRGTLPAPPSLPPRDDRSFSAPGGRIVRFFSPLRFCCFVLVAGAALHTFRVNNASPVVASLSPPPLSASSLASLARLAPEDVVFAEKLFRLLAEDGDPWDVARDAWEKGRVWPATFVRSSKLFVPPPPKELADTLAPTALADLVAKKTRDFSIALPVDAKTAPIFTYHQEAAYYASCV
jgi:hypothetical protein